MKKEFIYFFVGVLLTSLVFLAFQVMYGFPAIHGFEDRINNIEIGDPYGYHRNNCGAGEYFVEIPAGSGLGLCFEVNERAEQAWEQAFKTCSDLGKRLPDYMEWRFACDGKYSGASGTVNSNLNNMTGNWEWVESRPSAMSDSTDNGAGDILFHSVYQTAG